MAFFNNSADLAATTNTTLRTVTTGQTASYTVRFVNRTVSPINIRFAIAAATGTPTSAEWVGAYDVPIPPASIPYEITGLTATSAKNIVAYASAAGISVGIHGFEE
jgi:hypothetical protein